MLVSDRMSHPVITITPQASLDDAWQLMSREKISRLPVVDKKGKLVGIVTEKQILRYSPSLSTTLDVFEIKGVMSRMTIDKVMDTNVITISADTPIEEAARIMADNSISGIPVMENNQLVGMIAETDLFKAFLEVLGARQPGIRLTVLLDKAPGQLARFSKAIFDAGGNIISFGIFLGHSSEAGEVTLKVDGIQRDALVELVKPLVVEILDIREKGKL
jgi:acetoin utilization protein AcuB